MKNINILIDCDGGHDDVVAILYAFRHLNLVGITACFGQITVENVAANILGILSSANIAVPVAIGSRESLTGTVPNLFNVHGNTGLDGATLPPPKQEIESVNAVDFLIAQAKKYKGDLIVAITGPSTNVARALQQEPRLRDWIKEISIMGGSAGRGNVGPTVEFNAWADPEAADVVLHSGIPIRIIGYDITSTIGIDADSITQLRRGGIVPQLIADLYSFYRQMQIELFGLSAAPVHDVCAIIPYVRPDMIAYTPCHIAMELRGEFTRGMTVCDRRTLSEKGRKLRNGALPNTLLAIDAHRVAIIQDIIEMLLSFTEISNADPASK